MTTFFRTFTGAIVLPLILSACAAGAPASGPPTPSSVIGVAATSVTAAVAASPVAATAAQPTKPPTAVAAGAAQALLPTPRPTVLAAAVPPPGPMPWARSGHSATLLTNGQVLVAGGVDGQIQHHPDLLYDPVTARWSPGATGQDLSDVAVLLPNGKVLAVAGSTTAQVYDPTANAWTSTGDLPNFELLDTLTVMNTGKVLGIAATGWVLYDPVANTWSAGGAPIPNGADHTATLLANGKVLVVGSEPAQLYDPATNSFAAAGKMSAPRTGHTATLLANGQVLIAAGKGADPVTTAELYNPATDAWSPAGTMASERLDHTATLLPTGKVLVVGNLLHSDADPELYDPVANVWTTTPAMVASRTRSHTATLLPSGQVLVVGGDSGIGNVVNSAELYTPSSNSWATSGAAGPTTAAQPVGQPTAAVGAPRVAPAVAPTIAKPTAIVIAAVATTVAPAQAATIAAQPAVAGNAAVAPLAAVGTGASPCNLVTRAEAEDMVGKALTDGKVTTDHSATTCTYGDATNLTVTVLGGSYTKANLAQTRALYGAAASDISGLGDDAFRFSGLITFLKGSTMVTIATGYGTAYYDKELELAKKAASRM